MTNDQLRSVTEAVWWDGRDFGFAVGFFLGAALAISLAVAAVYFGAHP